MIKTAAATFAVALSLCAPAHAEMGVGLGLSWVFAPNGGQSGLAVGGKVFKDRDEHEFVPAIGVDYMLSDQSIRPNVGVAYQDGDLYGDASFGYNLSMGTLDFGLGVGASNSK